MKHIFEAISEGGGRIGMATHRNLADSVLEGVSELVSRLKEGVFQGAFRRNTGGANRRVALALLIMYAIGSPWLQCVSLFMELRAQCSPSFRGF